MMCCRHVSRRLQLGALVLWAALPVGVAAEDVPEGFVRIFNGRDLAGWRGDPEIWSVRDGAIVGETRGDAPIRENNYLVWDGDVESFELRLRYKIESGNSGIYCRAKRRPDGQTTPDPIIAWQADIDADGTWTGVIMEWTGRDKLAERGQIVEIDESGTRHVSGALGDPEALWSRVSKGDWNDYTVIARGGSVTLQINGVPMAKLVDRDPRRFMRGLLALQVHVGKPMRVWFKDILLKKGPEVVAPRARPFDLGAVRLLEGPFRDAMERDRRYLHDLEADRLVHMFRVNAGLPSDAEPLGGWERPDCEVRGHTLGHYLSACAMMYSSTGDEALKEKAEWIVAELSKCQKALGSSGYLSAYPETWIDRAEAVQPVWAPYYTLHKMFAGLLDVYRYCGDEQALAVLRGMVGWLENRTSGRTDEHMQRMLNGTEQGGMNDVLADVFALTGDPKHLALSQRFNQATYNDPLASREDRLKGLHVNSFIPNMIGTARQFELAGGERDHTIATFFWDQVVGARSYVTGGTSHHEHWRTDPHVLASELGPTTQETCCTYNMLKLTRHLFSWTADPRYADYYERALWTSILGTQDPKTGMMMYFVPLASGYWKVFNTPRDSFWCCTGTGMESFAKLGDSIYWHDADTLLVNLFIASEVDWSARGVRVRQETRFPEEEGTTLIVRAPEPTEFSLRIRVPWWARTGFVVRCGDDVIVEKAPPSSYVEIRRVWKDGDRVTVSMPLSLTVETMPDDPSLVALLYGPLVLAGKLGSDGLTPELTYRRGQGNHGPPVESPFFLLEKTGTLLDRVRPVGGQPLTFRTNGIGRPSDVTLVPYYRLFGERYAVYWKTYVEGSPEYAAMLERESARKARAIRVIDECRIGDPESERAHELQEERSRSGSFGGRQWRDAADGWFSYELKVLDGESVVLECSYWGSDGGSRTFDVLVDGRKIATQTLEQNRPGEFFEVEHPLSPEVTKGKKTVTVRFQAHPGNLAGGVFGLAILKPRK